MPTYPQSPKGFRIEFKNMTKAFLVNHVGSLEGIKEQCTLTYVHENQTRSTYGIPLRFEMEYKRWAIQELRKRFGEESVPAQSWE